MTLRRAIQNQIYSSGSNRTQSYRKTSSASCASSTSPILISKSLQQNLRCQQRPRRVKVSPPLPLPSTAAMSTMPSHPRILVGHQKRPPGDPQAALGLSVGCFVGTGYGLFVGFGSLRPFGRNSALVTPDLSATPFAYDGTLTGAFCGATLGAGFASAVAMHVGYRWSILADLLPSRDVAQRHHRAPQQLILAWLRRRLSTVTRQAARASEVVLCPRTAASP